LPKTVIVSFLFVFLAMFLQFVSIIPAGFAMQAEFIGTAVPSTI